MRVLLDTHVAIWAIATPDELSTGSRAALVDPRNDVLVSAACCWEVAIKRRLGKLVFEGSLARQAVDNRFLLLPVTAQHAEAVENLPWRADHRDPFDRLLVAQAITEGATLVTRDRRMLDGYGCETLVA